MSALFRQEGGEGTPAHMSERSAKRRVSAEWVKHAREKILKLTQQELANQLGVDRSMVGKWEIGENSPSWRNVRKIDALLTDLPGRQTPVIQEPASVETRTGGDDMEQELLRLFRQLTGKEKVLLVAKLLADEEAGEPHSQGAAPPGKG